MSRYCPRVYEQVIVTRQLPAPVTADAIDTALRLAERGVRCHGEPDQWCEVSSQDDLRLVRFTALPGGEVAVTHIVAQWLECGGQVRYLSRYGTARYAHLEVSEPRAVRALAVLRTLPGRGPDSHGS